MTKAKMWGRWNMRTRQLAPMGDLIDVSPYLYVSRAAASRAIDVHGTRQEESPVEVDVIVKVKSQDQRLSDKR